MTLTVETGTMPPGANSYASVADCNDYQFARGSEDWPPAPEGGDDPNVAQKEAALVRATDYLNGLAWKGKKASGGRVMAWPRIEVEDADGYVVPADSVPLNVVYACCYLAGLVYAGTDVQPVLERGGRIQSEKVSTLETSFFEDAANRDVFSALADLLNGLALGFGDYAGVGVKGGGDRMGKVVLG